MSVKVSSWVWHGDETASLSGNEMILLLALADVADDNGRCRFMTDDDDLTYGGLARKARVDRRTIERLIPRLRGRGLLEHERGTKTRPNEFTILVPWATRTADKLSGQGSDSPTAVHGFPDNGDESSSLIRIDVDNVLVSPPDGGGESVDLFDKFWAAYPRKAGKVAARKAFAAAARSVGGQVIVDGARRFAGDPNLPEKQFIPHPATWLSRGSWDDEALPARATSAASAAAVAPSSADFGVEDSWMAFSR